MHEPRTRRLSFPLLPGASSTCDLGTGFNGGCMTPPNAFRLFRLIVSDFLGKQSAQWPLQSSKHIQICSRNGIGSHWPIVSLGGGSFGFQLSVRERSYVTHEPGELGVSLDADVSTANFLQGSHQGECSGFPLENTDSRIEVMFSVLSPVCL